MRVALLLLMMGMTGACNSIPCSDDASCPPQNYCKVQVLGGEGRCTQDCLTALQCGPEQLCDFTGRCIGLGGILELAVTEPADGVQVTPGTTVDVAGTVTVDLDPVTLEVAALDNVGCAPAFTQTLQLEPTGQRQAVPFRFTGVAVGEGGGTITARATTRGGEVKRAITYRSPTACNDCPAVRFDEPPPYTLLPDNTLGIIVAGRVEGTLRTPLLISVDPTGAELRLPLALEGTTFGGRVLPVSPGDNSVGVEVQGLTGSRRCLRRVTAGQVGAALSAHLSWEGTEADMDLALVPPGERVGSKACMANSRWDGCSFPTRDRTAPGPEAALLSSVEDGVYGVAVLTVPGEEGPVRATTVILGDGAVLTRMGPRNLDPRRNDVWLVARVQVQGGMRRVEVLDRVVPQAPASPPDAW
ncbi:MAG: hypothetical protein AB2A00_12995 [Myxococcota bacterium]